MLLLCNAAADAETVGLAPAGLPALDQAGTKASKCCLGATFQREWRPVTRLIRPPFQGGRGNVFSAPHLRPAVAPACGSATRVSENRSGSDSD